MSLPKYDIVEFLNHINRPSKQERIDNDNKKYGLFEPTTLILLDVPRLEEFLGVTKLPNFEMTYGKSVCCAEDEFVRKIGVEMATKNAKLMTFETRSIYIDSNRVIVNIRSGYIRLALEYRPGKGPVFHISGAGCNHG